nr:hypothetical protein CcurKRNrm3_p014 [Cryptomonas curvata]
MWPNWIRRRSTKPDIASSNLAKCVYFILIMTVKYFHHNKELCIYLNYVRRCWYMRFSHKKKKEIFFYFKKKNSLNYIYMFFIILFNYIFSIFFFFLNNKF